MGLTLAEKVLQRHMVRHGVERNGILEPDLVYIDMHFVHEMTSPQAFDALRAADRPVRRPDLTLALEDHAVPTKNIHLPLSDHLASGMLAALRRNCADFGIRLFRLGDAGQGIVHVVGPQLGLTQPGMTIVCGDSHTSTHGAFGALAFGIGTTEVEHVLATQTLTVPQFRTMAVNVTSADGRLQPDVSSKDVILAIIAQIGTAGGQGHVIEYRGNVMDNLSMEARMTICNMSIEAGAKAGMIAPDETTFEYLRSRPHAPSGSDWERAKADWLKLHSDSDAVFDREVFVDADRITPFASWGTNPAQSLPLSMCVPDPSAFADSARRAAAERALDYMGLKPGTPLKEIRVDRVFLGSCTNSRIEDLRAAAHVLRGRRVCESVRMLVVPGSMQVRAQAESEGLDRIFMAAGAEWHSSGCSICFAMGTDQLAPGERAASTSNRNFEGRQGKGGRTHLVSPIVAAATAVRGKLSAPSDLQ